MFINVKLLEIKFEKVMLCTLTIVFGVPEKFQKGLFFSKKK